MRNPFAILALVVGILVSAIFGYRALYPSAPKRVGVVKTVAEGQAIALSGMDYLSQLRTEGRLPGVASNEHQNAYIDGRLGSYPYSLTMHYNKGGGAVTNHYAIVQIKQGSPWQLKRAWQTDAKGKITQEWSVK
jgi:hypothetical protein